MSCGSSDEQEHHCCISHEFFKAAISNPNKIALIHSQIPTESSNTAVSSSDSTPPLYQGDQCFSFSDLLNSVHYLSSRLLGLQPRGKSNCGDQTTADAAQLSSGEVSEDTNVYRPKILAVYMPASVEYIISVLSVLRCGEAFLPLDPSWPDERILSVISDADPDLIITSASFSKDDKWNWLVENGVCPVLCFSLEDSLKERVSPLPLVWPCEEGKKRLFCYLMYTSGSTGKPKGVCGTERGLFNRFLWMQEAYPLNGNEVLLFKTSISFVDHLQEFLSAMLTACTLVVPPFNQLRQDPFSVANFLQAYYIDRLIAVPSLMRTILPALQSQVNMQIKSSLKLLVLSGEVFSLSLLDVLSNILPNTSILNLYGSTEVAGDCTYFDCKMLPMILEAESLTSVPIGIPISNCNVVLVSSDTDMPNQGEICVNGPCVSFGFCSKSGVMPLNSVKVHDNIICSCLVDNCGSQIYYKTGDFARRLQCGDLVFLGRTDRSVKVNGQRIALEEIENTVKGHPNVLDAAVISNEGPEEVLHLEAFFTLKDNDKSGDAGRSIRNWMTGKVPPAMIPSHFVYIKSLPISSSGKVDYTSLKGSSFLTRHGKNIIGNAKTSEILHLVKQAFCDALMVEDFSNDDDFFMMGGSSITAAQVSYSLGIDMRLLYKYPTPYRLQNAIIDERELYKVGVRSDFSWKSNLKAPGPNLSLKSEKCPLKNFHQKNDENAAVSKRFKVGLNKHVSSDSISLNDNTAWSSLVPVSCSFSRCNKIMYEREHKLEDSYQSTSPSEVLREREGVSMHELWKVPMDSCVDASPLIVSKHQDIYLFIGSHAQKFVCVNAKSGAVLWEVRLEGRIECSAAIVADFSQIVVGCYEGKIYFLDFLNGNIRWTFQTGAEVKCQPVVDIHRQVMWCGSHDHYLYALDYKNHCCIYKLSSGGSIFGSPAIDEVRETIYVVSTSGRLTAISLKALPFYTLWQCELEVPVFGSISVSSPHGHVICCLVDGNVVALDSGGSIIWQCRTGGPIFAGTCMSSVLPSQVLVSSRNGSVYSFQMETGDLLWEYNVGDPITASAYIDEHLQLVSHASHESNRLVCVCTSTGRIHLLRVNLNFLGKEKQSTQYVVEEVARLQLPGDIFSSPVMVGGRIFVGCRDDYVHCISLGSVV
ncbi:AMP-dependent synthetase and ligase family protein [Euphorbia peplus]|nr:AMP-dependent synthetase and ligase family protein [Euphorbia peplus]